MKALLYSSLSAAVMIGTVAVAVLIPATDKTRGPMSLLILLNTFAVSPALMIAGARD